MHSIIFAFEASWEPCLILWLLPPFRFKLHFQKANSNDIKMQLWSSLLSEKELFFGEIWLQFRRFRQQTEYDKRNFVVFLREERIKILLENHFARIPEELVTFRKLLFRVQTWSNQSPNETSKDDFVNKLAHIYIYMVVSLPPLMIGGRTMHFSTYRSFVLLSGNIGWLNYSPSKNFQAYN